MASDAKDIQLREMKDTISQLKTIICEQTELIKSLRLITDEKSSHEKALQEQVDYLTKKLFGFSSERRSDDIPGQQSPGTEGRRTPGTAAILHVAVPQRRRRSSRHYLIWLFSNQEWQPCKGVSGRLSRISEISSRASASERDDRRSARRACTWSEKLQSFKNHM